MSFISLPDRAHSDVKPTGIIPWLAAVLVCFVCLVVSAGLHAATTEIPTYDIAHVDQVDDLNVLLWHDPDATASFDQLPDDLSAWQLRFVKHPALNSGRTWLRFQLKNSASETRRAIVSFDEIFAEEADLYLPHPSGTVEHRINGLQIPIADRRIKTRMAAFDLALAPGQVQEVILSYRSQYEAIIGVNVQQPAVFAAWVERTTGGYMFFMGGVLAIVLFNLFLYVSLRESIYLFFSAHAIFVTLFVAMYSGLSLYWVSTPAGHYKLAAVTWIQAVALIEFTRRILRTRDLALWLDRLLQVSSVVMVLATVVTFFGMEYYALGVRVSFPVHMVLLLAGVISVRSGDPMGRFFLLAQTPFLLGTLMLIGLSLGFLNYSPVYRYSFLVGSLVELVTFALALGWRFRVVEKDKFSAQEKLLSLQSSLNEQLQQQVEERTADLRKASGQLSTINKDYESLLQNIGIGVVRFGVDGELTFANQAYSQLAESLPNLQSAIQSRLQKSSATETIELTLADSRRNEHHFLINSSERIDEAGVRTGVWLVITDLTEIRLQESRLNHTSKMATLGEMSTGMAHELNQPLNAIRLSAGTLTRSLARGNVDAEKIQAKLARINEQVERASKLISHMRTFGRVAEDGFERFDVAVSIRRAVDLISEQLRLDQVVLSIDLLDAGPHYSMGSGSQFEQVILNMITNARDAIKQNRLERTINISLRRQDYMQEIVVEDTGGGIPPNIINRIFEPFFTTKVVGEGTGLGGAISYGIVKDMHGDISVSNTERGARFVITLPAVD